MEQINCDVLVVGGGAAGSRAAYEAKKFNPDAVVVMAVAGRYGHSGSSTLIASESLGINAPFNYMADGDNPDIFYNDIVTTGGGLADPKLCRIIADESCARLSELMELGLQFDCKAGKPIQRLLSGCTRARSLTCGGSTGLQIVNVLKRAGHSLGVKVFENVRIVELIQDKYGEVCGALGIMDGREIIFKTAAVVLATGGAGRIFRKNINPPTLEGDGWAMAYACGAKFVNMEFFQVGPAVVNRNIHFIIHSHMWRLKPRLTNSQGEAFLARYCPAEVTPEQALDDKAMSYPFSVRTNAKYVDIAIFKELMAGRGTKNDGVYFDVTNVKKETLIERAPITYETLSKAGLDLTKEQIELGLVVQNFNGGIMIDENGYTGVPGLFAAGEITGGVHGSDRPGGNNLTDTQVFGYRAGIAAARYAQSCGHKEKFSRGQIEIPVIVPSKREQEIRQESENLFYREMTIVRTAQGLQRTIDFIEESLQETLSPMMRNRLLVGRILALAMLKREESRGTHYREDYPNSDPLWMRRIIIKKGPTGEPTVNTSK